MFRRLEGRRLVREAFCRSYTGEIHLRIKSLQNDSSARTAQMTPDTPTPPARRMSPDAMPVVIGVFRPLHTPSKRISLLTQEQRNICIPDDMHGGFSEEFLQPVVFDTIADDNQICVPVGRVLEQ